MSLWWWRLREHWRESLCFLVGGEIGSTLQIKKRCLYFTEPINSIQCTHKNRFSPRYMSSFYICDCLCRKVRTNMYHCTEFNTLRPTQHGCHFPDHIFECIFLYENVRISIKGSLKSVPTGLTHNISALVQIMAWRRPGASHYLNQWWPSYPTHICVSRPQWVNLRICFEHINNFSCHKGTRLLPMSTRPPVTQHPGNPVEPSPSSPPSYNDVLQRTSQRLHELITETLQNKYCLNLETKDHIDALINARKA